jgi:hypothetical protein
MKKALLLLLCFIGSIQPLFAQSIQGAFKAGGPGTDRIGELKTDPAGNLYSLGSFEKSISFDEITLTTTNDRSFFLVKYSPDGKVVWARETAKTLQHNASYTGADIHVDAQGNITLIGSYANGIIIDNDTVYGNSTWDIYLVRYNTNGKSQWARSFGSNTGDETGSAIDVDEHGNLYMGGTLHNEIRLGSYTKNILVPMAYAAKVTPGGEVEWVQHSTYHKESVEYFLQYENYYYTLPQAYVYDIRVDKNGVVILYAGILAQDGWEGTGVFHEYDYDSFIRFNNEGKLLSKYEINNIDHESYTFLTRMDIDNEGNLYITGQEYYRPYSSGKVFVWKISPDAQNWWTSVTSADEHEDEMFFYYNSIGTDIHVSSNGKVYVTGHVRETAAYFGDILVSPNGSEVFISEISKEGKWLWVKTFPAQNIISGIGPRNWANHNQRLTSDAAGNLYLAGEFISSIELGATTLSSQGERDIFFSKWNVEEIENPLPNVFRFVLVDAATNEDYRLMRNDDIYYLTGEKNDPYTLPARYNIRAETRPEQVGSVQFTLNGSTIRTENEAPYALAGDRNGNYHAMPPLEPGNYTLTATPYSLPNRKGIKGEDFTIRFEVQEEYIPRSGKVKSFTLVNAETNTDVQEINDGDVLYMDLLPAALNIRANTLPEKVSYVDLKLNDIERREQSPPYALAGDINGNYHALRQKLAAGQYLLSATPTTIDEYMNIWGGNTASVRFEIKERQVARSTLADSETGLTSASRLFAYPNPFTQQVNLEVNVAEAGNIVLEIYDLQGRLISTLFNGPASPDLPLVYMFDGTNLPAGIYLSKLSTNKGAQFQKLVLAK